MAIRHHSSPEIQEFLVFYLLERLWDGDFVPRTLGREVECSSDGDFRPAPEDVRAALIACSERGWMVCDGPFSDRPASLSSEGRAELARLRRAAGEGPGSRDDREAAADWLICRLPADNRSEVLDVGTGKGFLAFKLAAAGFNVVGVDVDAHAIAAAQRREPPARGRVRFRHADICDLARAGECYSHVVSSYLLHECDDPVATLRAACDCLTPGGLLSFVDLAPSLTSYLRRAGRTPFHPFRALTEGDWRYLAPGLSLTELECLTIGHVALATARKTGPGAAKNAAATQRRTNP